MIDTQASLHCLVSADMSSRPLKKLKTKTLAFRSQMNSSLRLELEFETLGLEITTPQCKAL